MKTEERKNNLMPNNIPRYIRCYDNGGETFDRYTVIFSGRYRRYKTFEDEKRLPRYYSYVSMSTNPFHPQGFGQHGESKYFIDKPKYSHLGKKIKFIDLPEDCKMLVRNEYKNIWNIK